MADGRPAVGGEAAAPFPPLTSLFETLRIRATCGFFPFACVLPVLYILISMSAKAKMKHNSHDI
jgi:hypothetical protein